MFARARAPPASNERRGDKGTMDGVMATTTSDGDGDMYHHITIDGAAREGQEGKPASPLCFRLNLGGENTSSMLNLLNFTLS